MATSSTGTIDARKLEHYQNLAANWWDTNRKAAPMLHAMNKHRMEFIKKVVNVEQKSRPLEGLKILDVGCGGGILSESLGREGAFVTGIDASEEMINVATIHLPQVYNKNVRYINSPLEKLGSEHFGAYDVVVAAEVVQHVANPSLLIELCCKMLKPNGSIILSTLNRTWWSWLLIILFMQDLCGLIPQNTHKYSDLLTLEEVTAFLERNAVSVRTVKGTAYNILDKQFHDSPTTKISFVLHGIKADRVT